MRRTLNFAAAMCLSAALAAPASAAAATDPALDAAVGSPARSAEQKARDAARHPKESLAFWGLAPGMTILELQPGGGWWTEILAPYAHATGGRLYVTGADLANPALPEAAKKSRAEFEARFAAKPELYGTVNVINFGAKSAPLPTNQFDFILTSRSVHGWMMNDLTERMFRESFAALKPGGILALEQHRANPGPQDPKVPTGYVTEEFVIEQAKKAGFVLEARSEINANPKDTKDHPFGVWTLPPTRTSVPYGKGLPPDPSFDHTKYDAIGESDRMTLRFRKPK